MRRLRHRERRGRPLLHRVRPAAQRHRARGCGQRGGCCMITLLLLLAQTGEQPASQPASQPAQLQPGGTGADVSGTVTWIFEVDEKVLHVQESWSLSNESGRLVEKDHLRFPLPADTRRVNLDENVRGFKAAEDGSEIFATEAMGRGTKEISGAHMIDFSGDTVVVRRKLPVRLTGARVIVENI